jgi:hypothetical protein
VPGRTTIITPINPTAAADQRRHPTDSPRKSTESAMIRIGETKKIAVASATGRWGRLWMNMIEEPTMPNPLST